MDHGEIFIRWEREINAEWAKKDALCSYVKADREKIFRDFIIQKLITLFTMAEINGQRLMKIEGEKNEL
jgi:hypothetical protein